MCASEILSDSIFRALLRESVNTLSFAAWEDLKDPRSDCSAGETEGEGEEVEVGKGWGDVEVDVAVLEDMGRENPTRLLCSRLPASSLRPEVELEFPVPVAVPVPLALALAGPIGVVLRVTLAALLDTLVFVFVLAAV